MIWFWRRCTDIYLCGDRVGILPVHQRIDRVGRHRQPKRLARSSGTFRFGALSMTRVSCRSVGHVLDKRKTAQHSTALYCWYSPFAFSIQFLGASVICILGEIGGIITLNIVQIQVSCSFIFLFSESQLNCIGIDLLFHDLKLTDGRCRGTRLVGAQSRHS